MLGDGCALRESTSPVGPYFSLLVQREVSKRKHAPKSAPVRRCTTNGFPAGATCSGSLRRDIPVATKLSRPSWPADPLRAPLQTALPGVEHLQQAARFASLQTDATRSERRAVALAGDVGPLMAHRAAQRAQGSADRDVRRASSRQDVASKPCPEHVSSTGDSRSECAIRACFLLVTFLYTSKEKSLGLRAEIKLAVTNQGSYQSLPLAAA